jgi:membrane protein implicated in regulation of membrane protease activity
VTPQAPRQPSTPTGFGKVMVSVAKTIAAVFFGLMLLGLAIEHPWLFVVIIPAVGVGAVVLWRYRMAQLKVLEDYRRDVVGHRAEHQDKLVNDGDPRGTHGSYPPATEEDSK